MYNYKYMTNTGALGFISTFNNYVKSEHKMDMSQISQVKRMVNEKYLKIGYYEIKKELTLTGMTTVLELDESWFITEQLENVN